MKKHNKLHLAMYYGNWIFFAALTVFLFSCCNVLKPQNSPQIWTVVSVQKDDFRAKFGREYATFAKIPSDSVWVGKKITVSRGIK